MLQMFSQFFVQIFALYNFFAKICAKKGANFLWILYGSWAFIWCISVISTSRPAIFPNPLYWGPRGRRRRCAWIEVDQCSLWYFWLHLFMKRFWSWLNGSLSWSFVFDFITEMRAFHIFLVAVSVGRDKRRARMSSSTTATATTTTTPSSTTTTTTTPSSTTTTTFTWGSKLR